MSRRTVFPLALLLALLALLPVAPAAAGPSAAEPPDAAGPGARPAAERAQAVPGVLLVTTTDAAAAGRLSGAAASRRLAQRVTSVSVPPGQLRAAAARLAAQPGVLAVEPARYRQLLATPNDPLYPRQWAHELTDAPEAWDTTTGSGTVTVAVIDNGVDARHPDLRPNVVDQRVVAGGKASVVPPGSDNRQCAPSAGGDHGTHVAGIVGARGDDGRGVAGVAWRVRLMDLAVFSSVDGDCVASDVDVLAAIREATLADADVVNLSLGGFSPEESCSRAFQTVIDEARAAGTLVVAAAGNGEQDPEAAGRPTVPAACNGVVSVGAVTVNGDHAPYSSTNQYLDLVAPGGDSSSRFADRILSTVGDGGYDWLDGTSMAAPYVSGVAALLRSVAYQLTPDQLEAILEQSARDFGARGRDPVYGWGLVDVADAVALAASGAQPLPAPDPDFPVSEGDGGTLRPPPSGAPEVYRIADGSAVTRAVRQAVLTSRAAFGDGTGEHAVLARSDDFADALAGSSLTLGYGPLVFSGPTGPLPAETSAELQRVLPTGGTVYLLGGTAALPATLEAELRDAGFVPKRLAGRNREETAVAVAEELAGRRGELGLSDPGIVLLATGGNWPDAVTAGSLGAYYGIPILVTPTTALHPAPAALLRSLRPEVVVVGGTAAVSAATAAAAGEASGRSPTRVAGGDRYGTAIAVARLFEQLLDQALVSPSCVLAVNVVRPGAYAYALSASALAGGYGCVMVPVEGRGGERLPDVTRGFVYGVGVDGVLAGDTDVISDAAADDLEQLIQR